MKLRRGFVSNSSSSSYIIYGFDSRKEFNKIFTIAELNKIGDSIDNFDLLSLGDDGQYSHSNSKKDNQNPAGKFVGFLIMRHDEFDAGIDVPEDWNEMKDALKKAFEKDNLNLGLYCRTYSD